MENEDEFEDENNDIIRAKWVMDGATTLAEAADRLEGFAKYLRELEVDGKQLTGPVENDYGFYK